MKKQLIKQSIHGLPAIDETDRCLHKKCHWLIELHYETQGDLIEVVEISPKEKLDLIAAYNLIKAQAEALVPEDNHCGYRLYRIKHAHT